MYINTTLHSSNFIDLYLNFIVYRTISASTHHHAVDFNIFEGMTVHGVAEYVLSGGRVVVDEGQLKVVQGMGRYVPNPPFSPYVYDQVEAAEERRQEKEVPVRRTEEDYR